MLIRLYLDDADTPFTEVENAEDFSLDTSSIPDGEHRLRIETVEAGKAAGLREVSFTVRNGPGIALSGFHPGDEINGTVKLLVNATEAGIDARFNASSMETHRGIPLWVGGLAIAVILICGLYLATDPLRFRLYAREAERAARSEPKPAIPSSVAAELQKSLSINANNPDASAMELHLLADEFMPLTEIGSRPTDLSRGARLFAAKCSGCHGADAEGTKLETVTLATDGLYPRLAGQNRTYIYRQLTAFATGWRDSTQMVPMAKSLTEEDRRDIATFIETLGPPYPPRTTVPDEVLLRGKQLATRGDPEAGVVRCSACHGNNGVGAGPNFPALAGQWSGYLESQLHNWRSGARRNSWRGLMRPVAMGLSDADIAAVAAHYANLRLPAEHVSND